MLLHINQSNHLGDLYWILLSGKKTQEKRASFHTTSSLGSGKNVQALYAVEDTGPSEETMAFSGRTDKAAATDKTGTPLFCHHRGN